MINIGFALKLLITLFSLVQEKGPASTNFESKDNLQIDDYIEHVMSRHGIPGVACAIIQKDKIIHEQYYGYANLEHQVPAQANTNYRLYSLTKPFVAVGIFQLIEKGKISLDDYAHTYISGLPPSWNSIQIKHMLSHSTGLPDMAPLFEFKDLTEEEAKNKVFEQSIKFKSGNQYDYNQTGFWMLQKIIEKVEGKSMSESIIQNQFSETTDTAFFSSDSREIVMNRANPYFPFTKGHIMLDHSYLQGTYGHAKNGLNITLPEFIKWNHRLHHDELISPTSKKDMWQTINYAKSEKVFTHGWDKRILNGHNSYGFSGSFVTAYRIFPEDDLSIIFLSNGLSTWYNIENIINHLASLVDPQIVDYDNFIFEKLLQSAIKKESSDFELDYLELSKNNSTKNRSLENHINDVGYMLMNLQMIHKAIEVFKFNNKTYPNSWNTYDSLAEAYARNHEKENAIFYYSKALELNTENANDYNEIIKKTIEDLKRLKD